MEKEFLGRLDEKRNLSAVVSATGMLVLIPKIREPRVQLPLTEATVAGEVVDYNKEK